MRQFLKNMWNDESAQGSAEYILLLVAVIAIAVIFKDRITSIVSEKMGSIGSEIGNFK